MARKTLKTAKPLNYNVPFGPETIAAKNAEFVALERDLKTLNALNLPAETESEMQVIWSKMMAIHASLES